MDGEKDLARWVTTCGIDLFEQHITLRFPLVRLMNRLLIWCPAMKNWDLRQARLRFDGCSAFWTRHDTCICNAVPSRCTDCKHLELLTPCQGGGLGCSLPLGGNIELPNGERVTGDRFLPGRWEHCQWCGTEQSLCWGLMVNHSAASQCR